MTLAELVSGFRVLMLTPGFPQLLGLFGAVCVFLGAMMFSSNGHKMWFFTVIVTVVVVGEEILRLVYHRSVFGSVRPNHISIAILAYSVMVSGVILGYAAKSYAYGKTSTQFQDLEREIVEMLEQVNVDTKRKEEIIKEVASGISSKKK